MFDLEVPSSDGEELWEAHFSLYWFPTVLAADALGIPAALNEEPATAGELAERLGLNVRALGAVLALLSALGITVPRQGRFSLTDAARCYLLPKSAFYWGGILEGQRNHPICTRLVQVLTTPDPDEPVPVADSGAEERPGNSDGWATGDVPLVRARATARYMQSNAVALALSLAKNCDFGAARHLLDVGGGSGCFAIALAARNPQLNCTIFDLPAPCQVALEYVDAAGLRDRIDTYAADMFREPWPRGYDSMLLSNVLHDWRPNTAAFILDRAYEALEPGGTINIQELLLDDDGAGPKSAAALSVMMVVRTQGQQFTFAQLSTLLVEAGFVEVEFFPVAKRALVRATKR